MTDTIQGPAWSLADEYLSYEDPSFLADLDRVAKATESIEKEARVVAKALPRARNLMPEGEAPLIEACVACACLKQEARTRLGNLVSYVGFSLAVDGKDRRGKELRGILDSLAARLDCALAPLELLLVLAPEAFAEAFLADPKTASERFLLFHSRKQRERKLTLESEKILSTMAPSGLSAWGSLYDTLTGTMSCELAAKEGTRRMGLAEAATILRGRDRGERETAWRAIGAAFSGHEETCAAMLDAIAGWRLAEYGLRSRESKMGFLEPALHMNRMRSSTLEAMMAVVDESAEIGREALRLQARLSGVERLGPWDILAAPPALQGRAAPASLPFDEGLALVARAYGAVHPSMADFVRNEATALRIEGRAMAGKRPGAFCGEFPKSRKTRVYMTYAGSLSDVSTLAHELGHAYHAHLMSDLPLAESQYPMALAETASIFAETALGELLANEARDASARLEVAWSEAQDASTFLLNIPARFSFERRFHEMRADKPLGPETLSELMGEAWKRYYGDALSEYDAGFWRSKLHFYFTDVCFYNFPYTFGYLFSLGVYARRRELGPGFHDAYAALLRDTGRMEVEELAMRHLGVDLAKPEFWRASIAIVAEKLDSFRKLVDALAPRSSAKSL